MKIMKNLVIILSLISLRSCTEKKAKDLEVKKVEESNHSISSNELQVEVANALDPICEMETADYLSDTVQYKGQVYGFCSSGCKDKFKESPEKYLKKMQNN